MAVGNRQSRTRAQPYINLRRRHVGLCCAVDRVNFFRFWQPTPPNRRCWAGIAVVWLGLTVAACQPHTESLLADYQSRLSRVLHIPVQPLQKQTLSALPEIQQLSLHIPTVNIDLLELLALAPCDLEVLVAERNNSLGKVMADSSLLQYELQLLVKLGNCLNSPHLVAQLPAELQGKLTQIYQQKQQQLALVLANFLSRDPTLRQQLGGSQRGIATEQGGLAPTLHAIEQLRQLRRHIAAGDYVAASQININSALGQLYQSQLLADLQHSLRLTATVFNTVNTLLLPISSTQLCKVDPTVRDNLLQQIFIGRVQSELARIDGMAQQLLPPLLDLYQHHPLHASVQQRFAQPMQDLQQQLRQHVKFWQRWRQCPTKH